MNAPTLPAGLRDAASFARHLDRGVAAMLLLGIAAVFVPTYREMLAVVWSHDEQGQGPIVFAASMWLLWLRRERLAALPVPSRAGGGWALLLAGLLLHWVGATQDVLMFTVGSQIPVLAGLLWIFRGPAAVRLCAFPLFYLLFMIPLPGPVVAALTAPLKSAVSAAAASLLHPLGYPIGRSGVVLQIAQYQLLVADACAGLGSIFTLEALGLLYTEIRGGIPPLRRLVLVLLLVPIAFCANVVRVVVLVLVTYHFGNDAGQGFVHHFAGLLLFTAATLLMMVADALLARVLPDQRRAAP